MSTADLQARFIRMAWSHGGRSGTSTKKRNGPRNRKKLEWACDYGNKHFGAGTHWIIEE